MARTYSSKKVTVTAGYHIVTGFAEDSFINIEETGDGVQSVSGADGKVARSVSPDSRNTVKISLLQTSASNDYFMRRYKMDKADGNGSFPLLIKDLTGGQLFSADEAWVVKKPPFSRGKAVGNCEWEICAVGEFED